MKTYLKRAMNLAAAIVFAAAIASTGAAQPRSSPPGAVESPSRRARDLPPIDAVAFEPPADVLALLGGGAYDVAFEDGTITDLSRNREIKFRWRYPKGFKGDAPLIIVSHGGYGSDEGFTAYPHLGSTYARFGFVSISINHKKSSNEQMHRFDRAADVSFIIDVLTANNWAGGAVGDQLAPPKGFAGKLDLHNVGVTGHSFGGFTSHAVGGAQLAPTMGVTNFRDPRVRAIAPISAQGVDRFGSYDYGPEENSWSDIRIPVYSLAGTDEGGDWRRGAFERYRPPGDKFFTMGAGQNHGQMGNDGSDDVRRLIAWNTTLFFKAYLAAKPDITRKLRCRIGTVGWIDGWTIERKLDPDVGPRCK